MVIRLFDGDLHTVDWGEGPRELVTPVRAVRVGVGFYKKTINRPITNVKTYNWPIESIPSAPPPK